MPLLSEASAVMLGSTPVDAMYARDVQVWPMGAGFMLHVTRVDMVRVIDQVNLVTWDFVAGNEEWIYKIAATETVLGDAVWVPAAQAIELPSGEVEPGYISPTLSPTSMAALPAQAVRAKATVTLADKTDDITGPIKVQIIVSGQTGGTDGSLLTIGQSVTVLSADYPGDYITAPEIHINAGVFA